MGDDEAEVGVQGLAALLDKRPGVGAEESLGREAPGEPVDVPEALVQLLKVSEAPEDRPFRHGVLREVNAAAEGRRRREGEGGRGGGGRRSKNWGLCCFGGRTELLGALKESNKCRRQRREGKGEGSFRGGRGLRGGAR